MPIYYIITYSSAFCLRIISAIISWCFWLLPPPTNFVRKMKRTDSWLASVNRRRARKAQRHAAQSCDRFAFA